MSATAATFYVTGGTLRPDAPSYVERQADRDLYNALTRGEFCYILTSRQMGKSSLMARTAQRLRQGGVAVAVLDLTAFWEHRNGVVALAFSADGRTLAMASVAKTVGFLYAPTFAEIEAARQ